MLTAGGIFVSLLRPAVVYFHGHKPQIAEPIP